MRWGSVPRRGPRCGGVSLWGSAAKPTLWSMLIRWRAIDRSSTPNGILNNSKYDSQMLKREKKKKKKKNTHTDTKKKKKKPLKKQQGKRDLLALVFHSLSNRGGWEEVQNVGYHYTAPEWHDEKQPAPTALPEISSKHKFKYTVENLHSNPHLKKIHTNCG